MPLQFWPLSPCCSRLCPSGLPALQARAELLPRWRRRSIPCIPPPSMSVPSPAFVGGIDDSPAAADTGCKFTVLPFCTPLANYFASLFLISFLVCLSTCLSFFLTFFLTFFLSLDEMTLNPRREPLQIHATRQTRVSGCHHRAVGTSSRYWMCSPATCKAGWT